jgi:hypothetical protein
MLKVTIFSKIEFGRFCLYYIVYCSYDNANWQEAGGQQRYLVSKNL